MLKDCVRGQCSDWKKNARKEGSVYTQAIKKEAGRQTMRITGYVDRSQPGQAYACQLHGLIEYDARQKRFTRFEIVASGQRSGKSGANDRNNDLGPAPMGVAFTMYRSPVTP